MNDPRLIANLSNSSSTDDSENAIFKKTDDLRPITTNGSGATVLYYNVKANKKAKSEDRQNEFITDGGMKERDRKYYNSTKFNNFLPIRPSKASSTQPQGVLAQSNNFQTYNVTVNVNESINSSRNDRIIVVKKEKPKVVKQPKEEQPEYQDKSYKKSVTKQREYSADIRKSSSFKFSGFNSSGGRTITSDNEDRPLRDPFSVENSKLSKKYESKSIVNSDASDSKHKSKHEEANQISMSKLTKMERRKMVHVPKPKPKKQKDDSIMEMKIVTQDEKIENIEKLVKNYEEGIIRDVQKEVIGKSKQINDKIQKKLKYLSEKNMLENINFDEEINEEGEMDNNTENNTKSNHENNNIIIEKNERNRFCRDTNGTRSKSQPHMLTQTTKKPRVNIFELEELIKNERKKIDIPEIIPEKENSFRKSTSLNKSTPQYNLNDSRIVKSDVDDLNYLYGGAKRDKNEIYSFIQVKRQQDKENAIRVERELLDLNIKKLTELAKVNEIQRMLIEHSANNYRASRKYRAQSDKGNGRLIRNTFYIGKKAYVINNDEDREQYYRDWLEKHKLFKQRSCKPIGPRPKWNPCIDDNEKKKIKIIKTTNDLAKFSKNFKKDNNLMYLNDKHVIKSQSKEAFLKFLDDVKHTTLRSLDSHDILSVKSDKKRMESRMEIVKNESIKFEPESQLSRESRESRESQESRVTKESREREYIIENEIEEPKPEVPKVRANYSLSEKDIKLNFSNSADFGKESRIDRRMSTESDKMVAEYNPYNREAIEEFSFIIKFVINRFSLVTLFNHVEAAEINARFDFLSQTILTNVKAECFYQIYNYGIIMEEYNKQIAELYNEAFNNIDGIINNKYFELAKSAFEALKRGPSKKPADKSKSDISIQNESIRSVDQSIYQMEVDNSNVIEPMEQSYVSNRTDRKYNTYIYETISSKNNSSIIVYPNSMDSPKLSRIVELINRQRHERSSEVSEGYVDVIKESKQSSEEHSRSEVYKQKNYGEVSHEQGEYEQEEYEEYEEQEESGMYEDHSNVKSEIIDKPNFVDSHDQSRDRSEIYERPNFGNDSGEKQIHYSKLSNNEQESKPQSGSVRIDQSKESLKKSSKHSSQKNSKESIDEEIIISERVDTEPKENKHNSNLLQEEGDSIDEEISANLSRNYSPNKKSSGFIEYRSPKTDEDMSADKYTGSEIDWHTLSISKSNSNRDLKFHEDKDRSGIKIEHTETIKEEFSREKSKSNKEVSEDEYGFEENVSEEVEYEPENEDVLKLISEEHHDAAHGTILSNKSRNSELKNEHVIFDENNLPAISDEKVTIESEKKKSIESEGEKFFDVKKDENYKIHNLLDDKSSIDVKLATASIVSPNNENLKDSFITTSTVNFVIKDKKETNTISEVERPIIHNDFYDRLSLLDSDTLADEIVENVIAEILGCEVTGDAPLIKKKAHALKEPNISPNNSNNSVGFKLNDSVVSNSSIFMKTVVEEKKETSLKLYTTEIAPILVNRIVDYLSSTFNNIVDNLKTPVTHKPVDVIQSIVFRDHDLIKNSYRIPQPTNFINKKKILTDFEPINKKIRSEVNITSDNYYDNILNECLVDAACEVLEKERMYTDLGEPLPWSTRTRIINYKYTKTELSKKMLSQKIQKELTNGLNYKMGLITENHEMLDMDQLNQEREKRLMGNITSELGESDGLWKNYEIEETQIKLELSEAVLEQMLNEIVEILEHVQLSRKKPHLYQNKSIYACEEIPRLSIQAINMEPDNDNINQ